MFARIDRWIGRTLFVPLIVRFCQKTGFTQFFVHNYLYLIGSYMLLAAALNKGEGFVLIFFLALVFTLLTGFNPEYEGEPSPFLRGFFLLSTVIHTVAHVKGGAFLYADANWDLSCPVTLMWLTAEYARTIKTIPPLETKEKSRALVPVEVNK